MNFKIFDFIHTLFLKKRKLTLTLSHSLSKSNFPQNSSWQIGMMKANNEHYHSLGGIIAKERGGNQQLAKLTKGLERRLQGDRPAKNFKEL